MHSHIRIDAKRQALDALDNLRHGGDAAHGNGKPGNDAEIAAIIEVADDLTSQSRHSLLLNGSPPSGKLLIPLERPALSEQSESKGEMSEWLKEHAWKAIRATCIE